MRAFGILTSAFILVACSVTPSSGDSERALENYLKAKTKGVQVNIDDFSKTNGQEAESSGIKFYVVYFTANVSFPDGVRPECVQNGGEFRGFNCAFSGMDSIPAQAAGAAVTLSGSIAFQKTENGWVPVEVSARP